MLHTFFTRYRHAEAVSNKATSMHGAALSVFFSVVCVIDVAWILAWYSTLGDVSTGGEGVDMTTEIPRDDRSRSDLLAVLSPPGHVKIMQVVSSLLGEPCLLEGRRDGRGMCGA